MRKSSREAPDISTYINIAKKILGGRAPTLAHPRASTEVFVGVGHATNPPAKHHLSKINLNPRPPPPRNKNLRYATAHQLASNLFTIK